MTATGERGSSLVMAMLMVLVIAALGATFLGVSLTDRRIASNEADSTQAFAIAEAGIEDARSTLATTPLNPLLAAGGHLFTGAGFASGSYSVDVANNIGPRFPTAVVPLDAGGAANDTDQFLLLTSTGARRKARRTIETVVHVPLSFFNYGVWCDAGADFSGSSFLDAYDSSSGPYGGGNVTADASAFCNGDFTLSGSAEIRGSCTVGDASCDDDHVTGTRTTGVPAQTRTPVGCPAGGYPASVPAGSGVTYNAATGVLTVSGGNDLTLPVPPTSYYFSEVTLSGGSTLTLDNGGGAHVDIYVSGQMDTSGGGVVNTAANPTKLSLWACGAATTEWKLSGGSGAYFAVYAPTRKITISGGSELYGALVGREVVNSGGSRVHYDHALAGGTVPSVVSRTWREVFP